VSDPRTAPTDEQIRAAIDSGQTGDKVAWPDPAAAPLGTDAEAGGVATSPEARRADFAAQGKPFSPRPRGGAGGLAVYVVVGLVGLAAHGLLAVSSWVFNK